MRKTGIFGGSFNPIHNGHINLARQLLDVVGLDDVWFIVSPHNPLKDVDGLAADDIRLQMAQEALENEPNMQASDFEFKLPRPSYMYHTLQALKDKYPHREFYLLIGADNWACFDKWYAHDEIVLNYNIVVYPRKGTDVNTQHLPDRVRVVKTELYDISSTQIREYVSKGQSFENLVPSCVARIIRENNLYKQL